MEKTFAMIKPDGVDRGLLGEILQRIETAKFRILALKMMQPSRTQVASFYLEHSKQPFFQSLVEGLSAGPVVALILEADQGVQKFRQLLGATHPVQALPGTLRADYGLSLQENTVHGSNSLVSAGREIELFFPELHS